MQGTVIIPIRLESEPARPHLPQVRSRSFAALQNLWITHRQRFNHTAMRFRSTVQQANFCTDWGHCPEAQLQNDSHCHVNAAGNSGTAPLDPQRRRRGDICGAIMPSYGCLLPLRCRRLRRRHSSALAARRGRRPAAARRQRSGSSAAEILVFRPCGVARLHSWFAPRHHG